VASLQFSAIPFPVTVRAASCNMSRFERALMTTGRLAQLPPDLGHAAAILWSIGKDDAGASAALFASDDPWKICKGTDGRQAAGSGHYLCIIVPGYPWAPFRRPARPRRPTVVAEIPFSCASLLSSCGALFTATIHQRLWGNPYTASIS
jgi:hypothetical protein